MSRFSLFSFVVVVFYADFNTNLVILRLLVTLPTLLLGHKVDLSVTSTKCTYLSFWL